ncbi:hypothetical protein NQ315_012155 [Exocentrus adspersus]|uniref:Uncharacterized protein n=1 Tax=Exocentrus adspersus TaxID=1586481 RepID=A0AAV8VYR5_9CUCU|nr:hypothetical protein NQ315_012155 [Exocentrus adspersus]
MQKAVGCDERPNGLVMGLDMKIAGALQTLLQFLLGFFRDILGDHNLKFNITPIALDFFLLLALKLGLVLSKETFPNKESNQDLQPSNTGKVLYEYMAPVIQIPDVYSENQELQSYGYIPSTLPLLPQSQPPKIDLHAAIDGNPLLAALLLSASLGLSPKPVAPNHPQLLPINPYIALLLSQYGHYVPLYGSSKGLYGYAAANNFHNNKPFGAYKVHEDAK